MPKTKDFTITVKKCTYEQIRKVLRVINELNVNAVITDGTKKKILVIKKFNL